MPQDVYAQFWPVSGQITRVPALDVISHGYGPRFITSEGYDVHAGTDFNLPIGTAVYAAITGKVVSVNPWGWSHQNAGGTGAPYASIGQDTKGNQIIISDENPVLSQRKWYVYNHLDQITVSEGDIVTGGVQVGTSGNTGTSGSSSCGTTYTAFGGATFGNICGTAHLHFAVLVGRSPSTNLWVNEIFSENMLAEFAHSAPTGFKASFGVKTHKNYSNNEVYAAGLNVTAHGVEITIPLQSMVVDKVKLSGLDSSGITQTATLSFTNDINHAYSPATRNIQLHKGLYIGAEDNGGHETFTLFFAPTAYTRATEPQGNGSTILNATYGSFTTNRIFLSDFNSVLLYDGLGATNLLPSNTQYAVAANSTLGLNGFNQSIRSITGAGLVDLDSAALTLGSSTNFTFDGKIVGTGSIVKNGTGTLTLSGVNTYSGTTTVGAGALLVAAGGSIASSPAVVQAGATLIVNGTASNIQAGGTLSGTGTVGFTQVFGTFAPGSGIAGSTMTLANGINFQPGATYGVQISPTAASSAIVTGAATLAGTVNAQFAPGSYVARNYTILTSTLGLGGTTFNALTTNGLPAGFIATLGYTGNNVLLNLNAMLGTATAVGTTLKGNQQHVATSINNFFNNGGALPPAFVSVFGLTGANLDNALTQPSGETATGSQQTTFGAMTQFMEVMTDPFLAGRGNATAGASAALFADESESGNSVRNAYATFNKAPLASNYEPRWSVWAAGFGGSQTTDGSTAAGSNSTTSRVFGTAVGADYRFSPFTIAGFALTGGGTNFSVANGGSGRSDLFQAGAFFKHNIGAAYLSGASAYGWQDVTTDRTVTVAGIDRLRAAFNANAWSGRLESGYRFVMPLFDGIGLTPYAAGQFTTFDLPAYAEKVLSGASTFALAYGSKSVTDSRSELGLRTDKSFAMPNGVFTLRGRAAWAHDFNPDHAVAATFQALPGASFVVNGAAQARNSALTTASAEVKWLNGWSAAATFEGEFSDVTRSYAGKGVVRYSW